MSAWLLTGLTCLSSRDSDPPTSLGSLLQYLATLLVNFFFLISSLNPPWHNLRPSYPCFPASPFCNLLLRSCREWQCLSSASFSPGWTTSAPLKLDLWLEPFTSLISVLWTGPSTSGEPKTGHRTEDVPSPVPCTGAPSLPWSSWYKTRCRWPFWPLGHNLVHV